MPKLILIAAIAENGVIGRENALPWGNTLPRDMARFRDITKAVGNVIMGRKTAESLGKPLPKRQNFCMARDIERVPEGFTWMPTLDRLGMFLGEKDTLAVIGGAEIYRLAAPYASLAYITRVCTAFKGDAFYPIDSLDSYTRKGDVQRFASDAQNKHSMQFITLQNNAIQPLHKNEEKS